MPKGIEHRRFRATELRVAGGDGGKKVIHGMSAVYDQETVIMGWFREVIRPGAFARALKGEDDARALFNHDPNQVLGRASAKTLRLFDEAKGLRMEADPPDTAAARDVITLIERGDVTGQSFSFRTLKDRWTFARGDGELDLRELLEVELWDVGPVTFPAYEQTDVGVRSAMDEARRLHEAARLARGSPLLARARLATAEAEL